MEEIQRDEMPVDVLFVGAGPGNLLGAWHLMKLMKAHNADIEKGVKQGKPLPLDEMTIMIIEKGAEVGAHNFSGAVLDPISIQEVMPDWLEKGAPVEGKVEEDAVMFLTESSAFKLPITPPPLDNHGNYVISLSKICRWLGSLCEAEGVQIYPGFPGVKVLFDEDKRVKGVQTGDKGLDPDGNPKDNFEPGILLTSKVTVFGEGPRGNLVKQLESELGIAKGKNPQSYEMGVKEIFELPEGHGRFKAGQVWHTMGHPLPMFGTTFGGGFVYGMGENRLAVGMVVDLHSPDPYLDAHRELQKLKAHPWVSKLIEGGKVVQYGGKALAIGGYLAMPKLSMAGGLVVGDSASMLNGQRLKGIHTAMRSGMLAAETILEALVANRFDRAQLSRFEAKVKGSDLYRELYEVRNSHQGFRHGRLWGLIENGLQYVTRGMGLLGDLHAEAGHEKMRKLHVFNRLPAYSGEFQQAPPQRVDNRLAFDKVSDVYRSGTEHSEDQPAHLKILDPHICIERCTVEFGNPCQYFCPAAVYEIEEVAGGRRPKINFSNCVHCKTCDIIDPYQIIDWVTPEGGGGPNYINL